MASRPPETQAQLRAWPGDADVAVALTFDVDAESAWLGEGSEYARRLTTLSQAGFGPAGGPQGICPGRDRRSWALFEAGHHASRAASCWRWQHAA